ILALGELRAKSGRDVLAAYIIGVEITTRVGQGLNPFHRNRGWHATSTVGAIGAAAAAGRLIGLDTGRMRHALNMATSYAGGFMSQFGSMTKPLHAGKAAEAGVVCAFLAEAGMTAGSETLDGPTGMARLMVGPDLEELRRSGFKAEHGQTLRFEPATLGRPLAILAHGLKVKRYPTCASTHRALDGILELQEKHKFAAVDVTRIDVFAPVTHFNNLMYTDPSTPAEAKFSMEYCAAVAIENGGIGLADFAQSALAAPRVRHTMTKVVRHPIDRPESEFPTKVEITLTSGQSVSVHIDAPKGRVDNPLSEEELWQKLRLCCRGTIEAGRAARIETSLRRIDGDEPIATLMSELRFETAAT
ncbi:MAG: MmgE/PrpD family protein, partial [Alphaproteobacteria bacterium]|nr:MmgE/PrpD family protein [Alphaproteobacteria bacterium]